MRLVANKQLTGDYGTVTAGQRFECPDEVGRQLIQGGHARAFEAPQVMYETKVIEPEAPEVSPRDPFRNGALSHAEQAAMAPEGHSLLAESDVPEPGAADPGGRGRRARSGSGR
jgi:hypothetical protein